MSTPPLFPTPQAASLTKAFKVKKFLNYDYNPYPIEVHYDRVADEAAADADAAAAATKRVVLEIFPRGNLIPKRKVMVVASVEGAV